ncbi:MAG: phosphoribosylformylglycinamidine cyclo-ligase [Acidobacteria bacterium]|nr:phosphoribosylformylglycinamidine cyclo-ligase [Acidobacteriota bacterium]
MPRPQSITYTSAGVDIDRANRAKARIKRLARNTFNRNVLSEIGSFGGLFRLARMREPVLVSSIDGVGTKIKVAIAANKHDSVGYDLVSHCVNDILVQGARPLFFLDYFAMGRLNPSVAAQVVAGIAKACRENECALIGGETAEMPDLYRRREYDLAGCIVGVVERRHMIDGSKIKSGDQIYGLESWGLHTNGYSLARVVFFQRLKLKPDSYVSQLQLTVSQALLTKHRCYFGDLASLVRKRMIHGLAHITGGGITENVPRILPPHLAARISLKAWTPLPIFSFIQEHGDVPRREMYRIFNMGIGMVVIIPRVRCKEIERFWRARGTTFHELGEVVPSRKSAVQYV